jgi:uncharacterized membrane protein YdjX (TVP38/TMEM64 family)
VERHARAAELLREEGFSLLLLLRVVPLIPYTLLNYVAGFAAVRPLPYLAATLLGVIPSTFIFAYFVDAVVQGVMRPRDVALRIVAAGLAMAALVIGTRLATKSIRARLSE